jgi:hypothetical protein
MSQTVRLGWREWVSLPSLALGPIRAKVDTGARSSALSVIEQETFFRGGREYVRFRPDGPGGKPGRLVEAGVLDRRTVTDSGGHRTERVFILTRFRIAGIEWDAEVNLAERRNLLFPMLIGRTALAGRFVVDPASSFLAGDHPPEGASA